MSECSFLDFQIAPSAKKLWGVEEQKDDTKGILNLNDHQMWRDSTWSTSGEYNVL
jgi:pumilio RNA-binding family